MNDSTDPDSQKSNSETKTQSPLPTTDENSSVQETEDLDLGDQLVPVPQRVAHSRRGMVSTAHWCATAAGVEMLEAGGSAMDAAVAAAFALGVCEPAASGLGGQTMMLVYDAEQRTTIALDGSSRAHSRALPDSLGSEERRRGHRASTVPSTPAVLQYAVERFGKLPLARVLEPAIRLARDGYPISQLQHSLTIRELASLRGGTAAQFFLDEQGNPFPVGARFRQPVLAETFQRIATHGVQDLYQGEIAKQIVEDMNRHGGLIQADDLANIPFPIERRPVSCRFEGHKILTFPPPGAGRTLVEMLNILNEFPETLWNPDTPKGALLLAFVIQQAFLDRRDRPFNPDFYPQIDDKTMVSPLHARKIARTIRKQIKTQGDTTHLSVTDRAGNAVALTQSIERVYGSFAASPELGFLYNNYMSAFEYKDPSHPYFLRPNAVPWASVAPTITFRNRKPWLVIGSPGSERITPSIMQVILRLRRQSPYDAVNAPRLHCSLKGTVSLEAGRMRDDIVDVLKSHGFAIKVRDPYSFYLGCVQLVVREGDGWRGVADPRRDGAAGGPKK